jgi:hypothetical protein
MFLDIIHRHVFIKKHNVSDWAQLSSFYLKTETESSLRNLVFLGPEIGTRSIDYAQLSKFYLKTKKESSFRNLVVLGPEGGTSSVDWATVW